MRKLWIRIGIGAGVVFASGLFVVTLARQVRSAAADAIRGGGRLAVPLPLVPFEVDGHRVGSIREIQVERVGERRVKQIRISVNLKGFDVDVGDCALLLGGHRGGHGKLFDCVTPSDADAGEYVKVGEVVFLPGRVTRPILLDRSHAEHWFEDVGQAEVHLEANGNGGLMIEGEDGDATFKLQADGAGLQIHARDADGREIVRIQAGASGLKLKLEEKGQ